MGATSKLKKQVRKNNPTEAPPQKNTITLATQMADPEQQGSIPEGTKRQVEDLTAMFIQLIHSDKTAGSVRDMLASAPPEQSIPQTANVLMGKVEGMMAQRRMKIPQDVKVAAATYVVSDLALLGSKAKLWEQPVGQEQLGPILQETMQMYIQRGLRNKTLDPIQLQREAEQLMTPEQKQRAMQYGTESGIPEGPTETMAAQQYADKAALKERGKAEQLAQENQQLRAALEAQQQNPAEQETGSALAGLQ